MKAILQWLGWGLAGIFVSLLGFLYATSWEPIPEAEAVTVKPDIVLASSTVRVQYKNGHGSGVHIGNGYIITAAHVLNEKLWDEGLTVKGEFGRIRKPEIMWANKDYDIALLRVKDYDDLSFSRIACDVAESGTAIEAKGYPLGFEQFSYRGYVSGKPQTFDRWKLGVVLDISLAPGASGGPVFDHRGDVIGIAVGVRMFRLGMSVMPSGVAIAVPGKVVCDLMGRL